MREPATQIVVWPLLTLAEEGVLNEMLEVMERAVPVAVEMADQTALERTGEQTLVVEVAVEGGMMLTISGAAVVLAS